jgi:signal transduction histidine kinase
VTWETREQQNLCRFAVKDARPVRLYGVLMKAPEANNHFHPYSGAVDVSGQIASLLACALPLANGVAEGWNAGHIVLYLTFAFTYLLLTRLYVLPGRLGTWMRAIPQLYFPLVGLIGMGLIAISGDSVIQPVVITVPYVQALISQPPPRPSYIALLYVALLAAGIMLSGERSTAGVLIPVAVYGALLIFMRAFTRMAVEQNRAREHADQLAADLARQRDEATALAQENAQLYAQARLTATLSERNRIARELHDTIAQGLTALTMQLDAAQRSFERDPQRARARLARAHELARATLADVRHSVWALAEPQIDAASLSEALAAQTAAFAERSGVAARYQHYGGPIVVPGETASQVVRIVQEALHNVEKHAAARSVEVGTCVEEDGLLLWIEDDGVGFDPGQRRRDERASGFGLKGMQERARLAEGSLSLSSAPGAGTRVELLVRSQEAGDRRQKAAGRGPDAET